MIIRSSVPYLEFLGFLSQYNLLGFEINRDIRILLARLFSVYTLYVTISRTVPKNRRETLNGGLVKRP